MLLHMIVSAVLFFVILVFVFHTTVVQSNEMELNEAQASLTQAQMLNDTYLRSISDYMIQAMTPMKCREPCTAPRLPNICPSVPAAPMKP